MLASIGVALALAASLVVLLRTHREVRSVHGQLATLVGAVHGMGTPVEDVIDHPLLTPGHAAPASLSHPEKWTVAIIGATAEEIATCLAGQGDLDGIPDDYRIQFGLPEGVTDGGLQPAPVALKSDEIAGRPTPFFVMVDQVGTVQGVASSSEYRSMSEFVADGEAHGVGPKGSAVPGTT